MEHSYTRDFRLLESSQTAMTRTLMIHRPPQCPSCHTHSHDERIDLEESYNPPIPSYNEESARRAMQESENIVVTARNSVSDEDDWEERVNTFGWTVQQFKLFDRVARLLDMDRLARLTNTEKQHEPVHRRTVIDKSVSRLRQALASVSWETRLTQWLHVLLMENLPPSYLAIYIDILQTLHAKLPMLANKMIFGSSLNVGQELLRPVLKKPWEPIVSHKNRKLPGQPYIVVAPSVPNFSQPTARQQKWFSLFATMSSVIPIQGTQGKNNIDKQSLQLLAENMVATTRAKIQQVRSNAPNRSIILVGFDAGSAIAIQVGLVESVSCVICLGFSYNTYNGVRGTPDDHIVDIGCPVLFVIGQNSARASHEEIEMLRERMSTQTSLVVVGAADECLRVSKTKRKIEGVTQSMVDNMVADEIAEFATNCLVSPPRTKQSSMGGQFTNGVCQSEAMSQTQRPDSELTSQRKRKHASDVKTDYKVQKKSHNRRSTKSSSAQPPDSTLSTSQSSQDALDVAIQSILPTTPDKQIKTEKIILPLPKSDEVLKFESGGTQFISARASTPIVLPALKREAAHSSLSTGAQQQQQQHHQGNVNVKLIESNQLIHLKPATGTTQKFYSVKSTSKPVVSVLANASPGASDGAISSTEISSPPKFTIVRSIGSTPNVFSSAGDANATSKVVKDLTDTNIFDLPIVFADNDGVIQEGSPEKPKQDVRPASGGASATVTSTVTSLGGSPTSESSTTPVQSTGNRFITLQQSSGGMPQISLGKNSKQLVVINKGTLKPVDPSMMLPVGTKINLPLNVASSATVANSTTGNVVTTGVGARPKFTKLLLTKPLTTTGTSSGVVKNLGELLSGSKFGIVNCGTGVKQTTVTGGTPVTVNKNQIQSIVLNPFNASKLQQTGKEATGGGTIVAQGASIAGSGIPIVGSNKILIKTTTSALSAASATPSLVGRNLKFNIVSTSTGTKQSNITTRSVDGSPKEK